MLTLPRQAPRMRNSLNEQHLGEARRLGVSLTSRLAQPVQPRYYAIRPQALIPWDAPIREAFEPNDSAKSYADYLMKVKIILEELGETCKKNGYSLSDLPELVGRPNDSSLVKLNDEYFWVTITNKCKAPSNQVLEQWTGWAHGI